jgi:pimeloyl-ACP methyl ester carboxylesterase
VVLALPSSTRDGKGIRDAWMPAADRHGLLVVAINFPKSTWSGRHGYNEGNVTTADGTPLPRARWTLNIPAHVFALLQQAGLTTRAKANLWGHSAGAQFAHRMLACTHQDSFEIVGAANAGLYTMPTLDAPYPAGLGGIGLTEADLVRYLAYKLEIIAGDQDLGPDHPETRDAALAQGANRLLRAGTFLARGQAEAARLGVPCDWQVIIAPDIAHRGKLMAQFTARHWFGD